MRDFFKPWRRKIGVVTLVVACVLMGCWMRSHRTIDDVKSQTVQFMSVQGGIFCEMERVPVDFRFSYDSRGVATQGITFHIYDNPFLWNWNKFGFAFGTETVEVTNEGDTESAHKVVRWYMPYWSIVIPATLLSAWLLLSKPRPAAPKQTTEPAPTTGAGHA